MIIETAKCTDEKVVSLQKIYTDMFAAFDEALKPGGEDMSTMEVTDCDFQRDQTYIRMASHAHNMIHHFDPDKAKIAQQACLLIDK